MQLELLSLINYRYSLHLLPSVCTVRKVQYLFREEEAVAARIRALPKFGNVHLLSGTTEPPFLSESFYLPPSVWEPSFC